MKALLTGEGRILRAFFFSHTMAYTVEKLKAKQLYTQEGKTIKEIAIVLGLPEKTIYRWKDKEDWDKDREALHLTGITTMRETLAHIINELRNIVVNKEAPPGKADELYKLYKMTKDMNKGIDARGNILLGMNELVEFFRTNHPEFLSDLEPYLVEFGSWVKRKYP